nr:4-hydroxy-3-methylbut-2-enyl diphosphate reductase [Synergistaceae bacterium]
MLNKNKINIVMADHAGFCFGVKRAVDAICEALNNNQENKEVWTIGLPIHNPQEVKRLEELGLKVANSINEIPDKNAKVLIRAHGEPLSVLNELKLKNAEVIDTTCPFVSRAQKYAADLSKQGYYIILL